MKFEIKNQWTNLDTFHMHIKKFQTEAPALKGARMFMQPDDYVWLCKLLTPHASAITHFMGYPIETSWDITAGSLYIGQSARE